MGKFVAIVTLVFSFVLPVSAQAATIALSPTDANGGQDYDSLFGMDFDANQPIKVTQLGVFDNHADGVLNTDSPSQPIVIQLWVRNTGVALASVDFGAGTGDGTIVALGVGQIFVKDLASPLILPVGNYYISEDYSHAELFTNSGAHPTIDDGGGLITFVGSGRASFGHNYIFPNGGGGFTDGGPANRYMGPDFTFSAVPEPASVVLFGFGAVGLLVAARRHRKA
jgi:PEP-CTERM motif